MRSRTQQDHALRVCRRALEVSLVRPARDHAGQRLTLAESVARTAAMSGRPPLGILLWPGGFPLVSIEDDLGLPAKYFRVVRHDFGRDWQHMFGADRTKPVFDPFSLARQCGEFGAMVRSRRFENIVTGIEACRATIAELLVGAGA
jgi:hypothetical protein